MTDQSSRSDVSLVNAYGDDIGADVAVIGMSGRFPGARTLAQFWENLANGVESVTVLSDAELARAGVPEDIRRAPDYVPVSSRLDDIDCFDAEFFGYSPREAALLDPQARVGLELAWHALEDAGYNSLDYAGSIGVFASASLSTYLLQNLAGRLDNQDFVLGLENIPLVLGNGPDFPATRVSYKLNLRGPSQAVQTACSSSLVAIHLARQSLLNNECDIALAGGVSIYLPQDRGYQWRDGMILSSDGHCRAFDAGADGVLFGRGGGVVVLKSLTRALEDGDRIRAVIKGSAVNNDGARKVGFTAPSVTGQSRVITEALADAGVRADTISYIEAHGTGTTLGDPIEVAGLTEAFRKHTKRTGYCALGTVKTNIGHLDVAAGVTAFIKTVLMLEHRELAPSLNYRAPNPAIEFSSSPFFVNTSLRPWAGIGGIRRAGVSAFGIGGTNAHVILEEAKTATRSLSGEQAVRPMNLMRVTARTEESLATLCASLADRLDDADAPDLADACFTANTGRAHHPRRVVVRGATTTEVREALVGATRGDDDPRVVRGARAVTSPPPIAFLFPGLGAQTVGMGAGLFRSEPVFRTALERCDAILRAYLPRPLLGVIYPAVGESSPIDETTYGQPVTFAFEYALTELWRSWGVRPAAVLGHSLGEYAGACLSGLIPLEEALRLVSTRARLADTLPSGGGMAAAFASEGQVRAAIGVDSDRVSIASVNGPDSQVMSGAVDALARVAGRLAAQGIEVRMLNVAQAFHSGMLDPILDEYEAAVARTPFGHLEIPVISNVTGGLLSDADGRTARYWRRHAREAVRFGDGVQTLYERGIRHFLEIGPHTTAMAMAAGCIDDESVVFLPSLRRGRDDFDQLFESLASLYVAGVEMDWNAIHAKHAGRRASLPGYPFVRTRHWIDAPVIGVVATVRESDANEAHQHPLLGAPVHSPMVDVPSFELRIDPATHRYLEDHRVFGATVFPATAYIEAALEAAESTLGQRATVVEDIEITEPLILAAGATPRAQIVLRPDADGTGFEIFSRSDEGASTAAWLRHASGRIAATSAGASTMHGRLEIDVIRARCTRELAGTQYYAELAARGYGYGPSFNGLSRLWMGNGELLAEVVNPDSIAKDAGEYQFHPALLDACVQTALGLTPDAGGRTFVPLRIARIELRGVAERLFVHAVRREDSIDRRTFIADVFIGDPHGEMVATVEGIVLHEASADRWAAGAAARGRQPWEKWLYEPAWRALPLSPQLENSNGAHVDGGGKRFLIVGAQSRLAISLAERMRADGAVASIVSNEALLADAGAALAAAAQGASLAAIVITGSGVADDAAAASLAGTHILLAVVQTLIVDATAGSTRVFVLTEGARSVLEGDTLPAVFDAPMWGLANVVALEHPELRCSCIDVDGVDVGAIDSQSLAGVWHELSADSPEARVAFRRGRRYVERIVRADRDVQSSTPRPGAHPGGMHRRLEATTPGTLDGLRYVEYPRRRPAAGEVEIRVRAAGLNFKDVLMALGRYPGAMSPLGNECAGDVVAIGPGVTEFRVGDRVIAFASGSLATHVIADSRLVARKPAALSFDQAATIAGGFLTAQYALSELAHVGPGDRVLIHAATGGVGLAAVQLARRAGATVLATAGSDAKRAFLASLGVEHVFNSRDSDFAAEIQKASDGRGVTVVLNSLTGEMLERSAALLADGGRFVELGMTGERSECLSRTAAYFNPNVALEAAADPARFGQMLREIVAAIESGELSPLPTQAFDASDIEAGFRLMARAGHIGKVVIRENAHAESIAVASTSRVGDGVRVEISPNDSYLIVGGLGGLGMLLVEWLGDRGARHVAIMGRRDPSVDESRALARIAERGVRVLLVRADVSRRDEVDAALARVTASMPPLKGVIHAAGVLDDGALGQQTWERFTRVMAPKIDGGWNLHRAVGDADLDFFILFSSVVSLLGSSGQGNHAAGNAFLDGLAHHRRARGLVALSINWGAWSAVGAAATRGTAERIALRGWGEIPPDQGLAVLERALGWPRAQLGVEPIDWPVYARQFPDGQLPPMLSEMVGKARVPAATPSRTADRSLAERVRLVSAGERRGLVEQSLREQVAKVLGLAPTQYVDADMPLVSLGLDSLLAVELRNTLNRGLGLTRRLPATLLFDYPTIATLTSRLLELLVEGIPSVSTPTVVAAPILNGASKSPIQSAPAMAMVTGGERDIADLTDEEAEALLLKELE